MRTRNDRIHKQGLNDILKKIQSNSVCSFRKLLSLVLKHTGMTAATQTGW